ncbi:MAG: methyltransferase, TIGR04325 family [Bacteroidia bacterium]|nr:methyltransferase, TIGR04325 family [Bacteroidia bacterium]
MISALNKLIHHYKLDRKFHKPTGYGLFKGVYATFDEAKKSAPNKNKTGYNTAELAQFYSNTLTTQLAEYDYPVLVWLSKIIKPNGTLFDLGGNVGTHYTKYSPILNLEQLKQYTVCDLEQIIEEGEKTNPRPNLKYTTNNTEAANAEIWLSSGTLQYIEDFNIVNYFNKLSTKPKHVIINRLPFHPTMQFVSLQNGGLNYYPQYIFYETLFLNQFELLGYKLIDQWFDKNDGCFIPFHQQHNKVLYKGFYFELIV